MRTIKHVVVAVCFTGGLLLMRAGGPALVGILLLTVPWFLITKRGGNLEWWRTVVVIMPPVLWVVLFMNVTTRLPLEERMGLMQDSSFLGLLWLIGMSSVLKLYVEKSEGDSLNLNEVRSSQ